MEYLNDEELTSLLAVTYGRDRLLHMALLVSVCHALRVTEMRTLTVDDVDGAYLSISALKKKETVTRLEPLHTSPNPLFDESVVAVHAHGLRVKGETLLFGGSRQSWDRKMKAACELAGIPRAKAHWHSLRHSTAMMVFRETVSLGAVKQALRHASWSSSLVYLNESDSQKAFAAVGDALAAMATQ
jgi:integrase